MPDFSPASYSSLIRAFGVLNYRCVDFAAAEPSQRHLILRHDVDMSLDLALEMARLEADLQVRSIYFVLLSSEFYNPFSQAGRRSLAAITECGHQIGLHFDPSLYLGDRAQLDAAAVNEVGRLQDLLGQPVEMISFHRPAQVLLGDPDPIGGIVHAYQPRFFNSMGYVSDSRGRWGHGHPLDHVAVCEGKALQLLTHPIWWMGEQGGAQRALDGFLMKRLRALDDALAENCDIHQKERLHLLEPEK